MAKHELKTWPVAFDALLFKAKTYEIRKNDRDYQVGDLLRLRRWCPESSEYTGPAVYREVTYMTNGGDWDIPDHLCILAVKPITASAYIDAPD